MGFMVFFKQFKETQYGEDDDIKISNIKILILISSLLLLSILISSLLLLLFIIVTTNKRVLVRLQEEEEQGHPSLISEIILVIYFLTYN